MPAPARERASEGRGQQAGPQAKPFLKWAGGKWALAPRLTALFPTDLERRVYREPFLGGGALFFYLSSRRPPKRCVLSDAVADLVTTYEVVRDDPDTLLRELDALKRAHSDEAFYRVRAAFNGRSGAPAERAAWLIYLNKTCYNGLFRTNRAGEFNVPVGRFEAPRIVDRARIHACSAALGGVQVTCQPFERILEDARKGDVIYLDPPYVPVSKTANFAAYSLGSFGPDDQERLAATFTKLDQRGCRLILSNSDTQEVRRLYAKFDLQVVVAPRNISANGKTRAPVAELIVRNVARW